MPERVQASHSTKESEKSMRMAAMQKGTKKAGPQASKQKAGNPGVLNGKEKSRKMSDVQFPSVNMGLLSGKAKTKR